MYSRCLLLSLPAAPLTFPPHNKRAPLNALYGVVVGVLESCHLIGSEDFAIPQSPQYMRQTAVRPDYFFGHDYIGHAPLRADYSDRTFW